MNKKNSTFKYTIKYSLLQGSYYPAYCATIGFASVFLLAHNFTNSQIGYVMAIANILAVFLQPILASFADTTTKISLKNLVAFVGIITAIFSAMTFFVSDIKLLLSVLLIIEMMLLYSLQPLANSLGMHMINRGIHLNFGFARGWGSLSFAVFSTIIGVLITYFGSDILILITVVMLLVLVCFSFTFTIKETDAKDDGKETSGSNSSLKSEASDGSSSSLSLFAFAAKYKKFILLLLAVAITFSCHMMINNYFIQIIENVGGNTKSMGSAIGLAAALELPAMSLFMVLVKKFPCSSILKVSFFFFLIKAILTFLAPNIIMIFVAQSLQAAAYAIFIPASIYYVNQIIRKEDLVKGQSFMAGAITLGGVLASFVGGLLLDYAGVKITLLVGVMASLIGLLLSIPSIEKTPDPRQSN